MDLLVHSRVEADTTVCMIMRGLPTSKGHIYFPCASFVDVFQIRGWLSCFVANGQVCTSLLKRLMLRLMPVFESDCTNLRLSICLTSLRARHDCYLRYLLYTYSVVH